MRYVTADFRDISTRVFSILTPDRKHSTRKEIRQRRDILSARSYANVTRVHAARTRLARECVW